MVAAFAEPESARGAAWPMHTRPAVHVPLQEFPHPLSAPHALLLQEQTFVSGAAVSRARVSYWAGASATFVSGATAASGFVATEVPVAVTEVVATFCVPVAVVAEVLTTVLPLVAVVAEVLMAVLLLVAIVAEVLLAVSILVTVAICTPVFAVATAVLLAVAVATEERVTVTVVEAVEVRAVVFVCAAELEGCEEGCPVDG
jgi:hypothetical protein